MTEQFQMTRRTILGGAAFAGVLTPIIAASMAHAEGSATETNAAATAADTHDLAGRDHALSAHDLDDAGGIAVFPEGQQKPRIAEQTRISAAITARSRGGS